MMGLHAVILNEEQKRKMDSGNSNEKSHYRKRRGEQFNAGRKDIFNDKNKGIDSRSGTDVTDFSSKSLNDRIVVSLQAKTELYDTLMHGETMMGTAALIDFNSKKRQLGADGDDDDTYRSHQDQDTYDKTKFTVEYEDRKAMETFIRDRVDQAITQPLNLSHAARIKSGWEKTLSSEAKAFLGDIHKDVNTCKEMETRNRQDKNSRRELILRKQRDRLCDRHQNGTNIENL
jgi:hypothetical protein